ncbi:MAG TPA: DUF86 domain-containing protein [Polyangiaceae bacterium]
MSLYVEDMVEAVRRVTQYSAGLTREAFMADAKTVDAVVRNLEILGEAAKHVSDATRVQHPAIEWRRIAGLRDILAHDYFGIDEDILWDVVANKVPALKPLLERALSAIEAR